jgi:hypothetical protein
MERTAQLRLLAGVSAPHLGSGHPLVGALRQAEQDDAAMARALALLDAVPSLPRRKILATFGMVMGANSRAARRTRAHPGRRPLSCDGEPVGKFSDLPKARGAQ